jgi:hypothetical protein
LLASEPVAPPPTEAAAPLAPAPVTDEEIAALLESAFVPDRMRLPTLSPDEPAEDGPRRRNLPRRSNAA